MGDTPDPLRYERLTMIGLGQRAAASDPGKRRRRNEDAYVVEPPLFAVADGMGGAQAGEIAAKIAASVLRESSGEQAVVELIKEANRRVYEAAAEDETRSGMGTTITAAIVEDDAVQIGHVGDSRAYRIRDGELEQLTEDHSLVAELVRSGKLSPEEADVHPQRSVITRTVGTDPDVDVDTFSVDARPGDVFFICSDGLTTMVDDRSILAIVQKNRASLDKAVRALVDAANKGGGEDNITIVLFEIGEEGAEGIEETATLPAVTEEADEDTLTEADRVPAIDDTTLMSRDELEAMTRRNGQRRPSPPRLPGGDHPRFVDARRRPRGARRLVALPLVLRRRGGKREDRGLPGVPVGHRRRRPSVPAALREPGARGRALAVGAAEALRPRPAELRRGREGGQAVRGGGRSVASA